MSGPQTVIIDTNVIIDVFVRAKDIRSRSPIELLRRIEAGEFLGILPSPVLIEIYYVVLDATHDPDRARKVLRTLLGSPNFMTLSIDPEHALQACEYYRQYNYFPLGHGTKLVKRDDGLSLVDCLVLAMGKAIPGAVVCSNESRFSQIKDVRVRKPWDLVDVPGMGERDSEGSGR
jgi:predicted nucleic acid-binding protein